MKKYQSIEFETKKEALKRISLNKKQYPERINFKIEKSINNKFIVTFLSIEIFK